MLILLTTSCAATGIGSPGGSTDSPPPKHEREIDRSEFRFQWPFTTGRGILSCNSGAITLQTAGVTYGLNDEAIARGFASAVPILMTRHRPPTNPLGRLPQGDRERIFGVAFGCDRAREPAKCRSGVRGQYGLSEAELEQIVVEGRERTWPPLEPARASVEPILEAGRRLCQ
jgi:hypothetical protein